MPKRIVSFRELVRLWREDYRRHFRRALEPGLHVIATHRLGVWAEGLGSRLARWPVKAIYYPLALYCEYVYGSRIEPSCRIGRRVLFAHGSAGIVMGWDVVVGDDCVLRHNVTLGRQRHDKPGDPTLGARVEVGAGAVIVGAITIGEDAVIGANTVVTSDVPPGAIVHAASATVRSPKPMPDRMPDPAPHRTTDPMSDWTSEPIRDRNPDRAAHETRRSGVN